MQDVRHEARELGLAGESELEADLEILELGFAGEKRSDEDERPARPRKLLRRLAQGAQRRRVFEVCLRVAEEPDAVPAARSNRLQREREVRRFRGVGGMGGGESARGAPRREGETEFCGDCAHQGLETGFLDRLA